MKEAGMSEQTEGAEPDLESRLLDAREALRVHMLDQPISGDRNTYSDGYGQGLATAIEHIDRVLGKEALTRPRAAVVAARGAEGGGGE